MALTSKVSTFGASAASLEISSSRGKSGTPFSFPHLTCEPFVRPPFRRKNGVTPHTHFTKPVPSLSPEQGLRAFCHSAALSPMFDWPDFPLIGCHFALRGPQCHIPQAPETQNPASLYEKRGLGI